jgi:RHS repeat-associated protein
LLPDPVASASYDAANEQTQFAETTLAYNANGNLTNDGTNTYQWDARNRLVSLSGPSLLASFSYDALGRRASKTINGMTTSYLYDGDDIVKETDGGGVGTNYMRSFNIDDPFVRQSTSNEYYHTDALGSALSLTNVASTITATYAYEPFGMAAITGISSNAFQFTGRENDEIGLYYFRARYYQPVRQRFLSEDPIRFSATSNQNLYAYVENDPINFDDPSGKLRIRPYKPIRTPINRPQYGNYCGPGNRAGQPINGLDRACKDHDNCYGGLGLSGYDAFKNPTDPQKCLQKDKCDEDLCKRAKDFIPTDSAGGLARQLIIVIFCK